MAAIDASQPPVKGFTLETREDYFYRELAAINRTHNWDAVRIHHDDLTNKDVEEEFDDLSEDEGVAAMLPPYLVPVRASLKASKKTIKFVVITPTLPQGVKVVGNMIG